MEEKVNSIPKDSLMEIPENLSPKQVEENLINDQEQRLEAGADTTAALFKKFHPEFLARVDRLSNKSLRRLIKAMVSLPLEDAKLNLKMDEEKQAFMVAMNLIDAKNYLMLYTKYKHAEELEKNKVSSNIEELTHVPSQEGIGSVDFSEENTDLLSKSQQANNGENVTNETETK